MSPPLPQPTVAAEVLLADIRRLYHELQQCPKRDIEHASDLIQQIHTKSLAFAQATGDMLIAIVTNTRGGDRRT